MPRLITRLAASVAIVAVVMLLQPEIVRPSVKVSNGLNLRSAPDQRAQRVALLPVGATVEVQRCLEDMKWCQVHYGDQRGWASADYLLASADGKSVKVAKAGKDIGVVIEPSQSGG